MQLKFFSKHQRHRRVIGLDIGNTQAHLLIAEKASPFAHLLALDSIAYDNNMFAQGIAIQPKTLAQILHPLLTAHAISHSVDSVALHIADEFIISDNIDTPCDLSVEELEAYITLELESRLSVSLTEIYFDFTVSGTYPNKYIFAACNKAIVNSRVQIVKSLGLLVNLVGIEKFLMANLHTHYQQHGLSTVELFKKWQIHPNVNHELLNQQTQTFAIAAAIALEVLCCSCI